MTFVIFVLDLFASVYFLYTWVPLSFDINESLLLIEEKKKEVMFGTVHKLLDVVHEYMTIQVKHARVPNNALFLSIEKII